MFTKTMSNKSPALKPLEPFYTSRDITLYCGRFENILPDLASDTISALITDPPYAITNLPWDKPVDWPIFWNEAHRVCRPNAPMVFFASGKFVPAMINSNPKHYRYDLVWEKNMPVGHLDANRRPLRSHESILIFSKLYKGSTYNPQKVVGKPHTIGKGSKPLHYGNTSGRTVPSQTNLYHPRSVLRFNNSRNGKSFHPTQKPLDLMKWLVLTYSDRNDTILEPFAGSGSTVIAAAELGRKVIAIEQSLEYCEVIANRLEKGG